MRNYSRTSKTVLKSNFIIVYQQLQNAINEYTFPDTLQAILPM